MPRRISININGDALDNRNRFLELFAKVKPDAICVMNNPRFALDVYNHCLNTGGTFFYRTWDARDSNYHLQVSPQVAADDLTREVNAWEAQLGTTLKDKWTFIYRYNEPAAGDIRTPLKWIRDYMAITASRGISVSAMEWASAKSINQSDIANGLWDDYLRDSFRLKTHVKQTVHDYISGVAWGDVAGAALLDFAALHPSKAPKKPLVEYLGQGSYEAPLYHIGREIGLYIKRASELGLSFDWYWIESFIDEMNDMPQLEQAKQQYPFPPYSPMKGYFGHKAYWDALLGHVLTWDEFADFIFLQAKWLDGVMPPNLKAMMNFTASFGTEWDVPHGFNLWDSRIRERFWNQVAEYHNAQSTTPPTEPPPVVTPPNLTLYPASVHSLKTSNVRQLPDTSASIVGTLTPAYLLCEISKDTVSNDGYEWLKLSSEVMSGWVAKTENLVITYIPDTPPPPITYTITIENFAASMTEENIRGLIATLQAKLEE